MTTLLGRRVVRRQRRHAARRAGRRGRAGRDHPGRGRRGLPRAGRAARRGGHPQRLRRHPRARRGRRLRASTGPGATSGPSSSSPRSPTRCATWRCASSSGSRSPRPRCTATTRWTCTSTRSGRSTRSPTSSGSARASSTSAATEVVVTPIAVGSGTVHGAHGTLPVPPPAVAELLTGVPSYAGPEGAPATELCTPTGAALLTTLATAYGPQPAMTTAAGRGRRRRPGSRGPRQRAAAARRQPGSRPRRPGRPAASSRPTSTTSTRGSGPPSSPRSSRPAPRRLADADPDEEGPPGAHLPRAGRTRPGGRGPRDRLPGDLDHRHPRVPRRQARARPRDHARRRRRHRDRSESRPAGRLVVNVQPEYDDVVRAAQALDRPTREVLAEALGRRPLRRLGPDGFHRHGADLRRHLRGRAARQDLPRDAGARDQVPPDPGLDRGRPRRSPCRRRWRCCSATRRRSCPRRPCSRPRC